MRGTVSRWNDRGFGFIRPDDGGDEIFCHVTEIRDGNCLRRGAQVEYAVKFNERKGNDQAADLTGGDNDR